jgi:hypothetical protein
MCGARRCRHHPSPGTVPIGHSCSACTPIAPAISKLIWIVAQQAVRRAHHGRDARARSVSKRAKRQSDPPRVCGDPGRLDPANAVVAAACRSRTHQRGSMPERVDDVRLPFADHLCEPRCSTPIARDQTCVHALRCARDASRPRTGDDRVCAVEACARCVSHVRAYRPLVRWHPAGQANSLTLRLDPARRSIQACVCVLLPGPMNNTRGRPGCGSSSKPPRPRRHPAAKLADGYVRAGA